MSYPPPPGVSGTSTPPGAHPSLPARPPPSKSTGFKPAFAPPSTTPKPFPPPTTPSYPTSTSHAPGTYTGHVAAASASQYGPARPLSYSAAPTVRAAPTYQSQARAPQYNQPSYRASGYSAPPSAASYSAAPQIRNPFPLPGSANEYDAEMAAQYAQWQSAYTTKDAGAANDGIAGSGRPTAGVGAPNVPPIANPAAAAAATELAAAAEQPEKKTTVVREGGGKKWTDDSLLEWDPSHLRLFVGNLAGEVTDDSLLKAFSRWKSVQKARVIRDKRTSKSKNFGFVSFSDPDDYFQAAKEMNGKYIQSHPVIVTRAKTEIKPTVVKDKDRRKNNKKGKRNNNQASEPFEPSLGPTPGAGVQKAGQRTKNGLKLLG
ncbi:related to RNA-binding protein [Cephalotrichum gorgonifer]|uniref:Related to RNA-binding protein n=1 Tax=Cephalotrichum gorgonifer TaxID=2041049 RepID=A0AAE8MQG3_9PEZI|nr:related to RNA-binding protein [Cephalotrichum gorgonifer]